MAGCFGRSKSVICITDSKHNYEIDKHESENTSGAKWPEAGLIEAGILSTFHSQYNLKQASLIKPNDD